MELAFAVSRSHAENPQEMAGREIAVVEIAGILSRLCKEGVWPCVVLAVMVHGQGLQGEVVTVLAQARGCSIPAHVEGFVTPKKPVCRKQLAFEGLGQVDHRHLLTVAPGCKLCIFCEQALRSSSDSRWRPRRCL